MSDGRVEEGMEEELKLGKTHRESVRRQSATERLFAVPGFSLPRSCLRWGKLCESYRFA